MNERINNGCPSGEILPTACSDGSGTSCESPDRDQCSQRLSLLPSYNTERGGRQRASTQFSCMTLLSCGQEPPLGSVLPGSCSGALACGFGKAQTYMYWESQKVSVRW